MTSATISVIPSSQTFASSSYLSYQEILDYLHSQEQDGKGETFIVGDATGFKKGETPKILVTACHHAAEMYGTYQAILKLLESNTPHEFISVPVVDVKLFVALHKQFSSYEQSPFLDEFVHDSISGYKGNPPPKMPWQYGKAEAPPVIKGIETLIDECDLVIDLHNSSLTSYLILSTPTHKKGELSYLELLRDQLSGEEPLFRGQLSYMNTMVGDGLYYHHSPSTIATYAAERGKMNVVLEVPIYTPLHERRNIKKLTNQVSRFLDFAMTNYS